MFLPCTFYSTLLHPLLEDSPFENPVFCNPCTLRLSHGIKSSDLEVIVASIYGLGMRLLAPQCVVQERLPTKVTLIGTAICALVSSYYTRQIAICWLLLAGAALLWMPGVMLT